MWSQYGEKHAGVCLVFRKDRLIESITSKYEHVIHGSISYTNSLKTVQRLVTITGKLIRNGFGKTIESKLGYARKILFIKDADYGDETEYRICVMSPDETSQHEFISIENSLHSIVLGADFKYGYIPLFERLGYKKRLPIYRLFYRNGVAALKQHFYF